MKRDATPKTRNLGLRRAFLLLLPLILAGGTWKVRQLEQPIDVEIPSPGIQRNPVDGSFSVKPQKIPVFHQLISRLTIELSKHPFATSLSVGQSTPWPKESGLDLYVSESLVLDWKKSTLSYTVESYGWVYSHVENKGLKLLAKAKLENDPITLPPSVHAQLRSRGWTLTEHYLP